MADAKGKILITIDASSKGAQKAINQLASSFEKLPSTINKLNSAVEKLAKSVQKVSSAGRSVDAFNKKMTTMDRRVQTAGKSVTKAHTEISKMGTASNKIQATTNNLNKASKGAENLAKNADKAEQQVEELAEAGMKLNKGQESLLKLMNIDPKTQFSAGQEGFLKALSPDHANKFQQGLFKSITGAMQQFAPIQQLVTGLFNKLGSATGVAGQFLSKFGATITGVAMPALLGVVGILGTATVAAVKFGWNLYNKVIPNLIKAFGSGMQRMIKGTAEALMQINKGYYYVLDAIRLSAQGITNLGRSMFFFLSIPMAGFFSKIGQEVLDFDDTLIRVRKTTGLSAETMKELQAELQAIARTTATSHTGLAKIAEQLGQLGLKSVGAIAMLTEQFNMLAVATDIAADEVGITMGRLAAAFEFDLETDLGRRQIINLANVVNKLENEFATSASEVVTATLKYAQAGHVMGVAAHQAAALSAALISMGISEEETGTALRNMSLYVVKNAKEVAKAMSAYEKYNDEAKVMNELNKDAIQVYLDIASAAQEGEGRAQNFLQLMNIGNMRGGRALQAMANNIELVRKAIAVANLEWQTHNSLVNEYNLAMQSTKNQFGLLKNNINDVGITMGEAVLPVLNRFMMLLVPAFQELAKFIKGLDDKTKLWIVALGLAVMVAGPLLMLFGQLVHAVALLGNGFGQLFKILPWILNNISFIPALLGKVIAGFFGWKGIVLAALVPIGLGFAKMFGVEIPNIMTWLTENMGKWGGTLMETLAKGLNEGAKLVVRVIQSIANFIASFFESHSPPKSGPLSTIDRWGSALMRTYLKGFTEADFGILTDVGRRIRDILTRGIDSSENPQQMVNALRRVADARQSLANLIDIFNRTGQISSNIMSSITSGLGEMGGDIQKLITLWLQYNKIQRDLANIENRRKNVNKNYKDEIKNISKSNMTLEQKVEAMRQTRLGRDAELQGLAEEEDLLESQKDELSERLDWQKQFIDALTEQDELFQDMKQSLQDLAGAAEDAFGGFSGEVDQAMEDAKQAFAEATESIRERLSEAQRAWQAFLDGFFGRPLMTPFEEERADIVGETRGAERENEYREGITGKYSVFYNLGKDIGGFVDQINGLWETVQTVWTDITGRFQEFGSDPATQETILKLQAIWDALSDFITGSTDAGEAWEHTKPTAEQQEAWTEAAELYERVYKAMENIVAIIDDVKTGIENFAEIFSTINSGPWNDFVEQFGEFKDVLSELLGYELGEANIFTSILSYLGSLVSLLTSTVLNGLTKFFETVTLFLDAINNMKNDTGENSIDNFLKIGWNLAKGIGEGLFGAAPAVIETAVSLITDMISAMNSEAQIESPSKVTEEMGKRLVEGLGDGLENNLSDLISRAEEWLQNLFDAMDKYMDDIIQDMKDWFEGTDGIITYWESSQFLNLWDAAGDGMIQGLWEGMKRVMADLKIWLEQEAIKLKDIVKSATNQSSPSKDFFLVGENIMTGMLNGMESVSPEINNYASSIQTPSMALAVPSYIPTNTSNTPITIEIKDNVFTDRRDMDRLASMISEKVQRELSDKSRRRV